MSFLAATGPSVVSAEFEQVDSFVLFANASLTVGPDAVILSGPIGVNSHHPGISADVQLRFADRASTGPNVDIYADRVSLGRSVIVGRLFSNRARAHRTAVTRDLRPGVAMPIVASFPEAQRFAVGRDDRIISRNARRIVKPGLYQDNYKG